MDSKELRGLMEAYAEMYAPQEVDEATAMAKRGYDEAPIRQNIAKSTGGGAAADRATALASRPSFGNDRAAQQRERLARIQRGDFRNTTSSSPGLRVGQFKSNDPKVQAKQAARGAQRGALTPAEKQQLNREEFDIFDVVLEFLQVEGFAETLEEAEWLMSNVIDDEAISIILGEDQLNELSDRTVSNALNARIAATGAAGDRAYKHRNPQAMRAAEDAADKEARMRSAVAKRRKRMNKEEYMDEAQDATSPKGQSKYGRKAPAGYMQTRKPTLQQMSSREKQAFKDRGIGEDFELWVNELVEEGYDLSDYTWDDMYEFYLGEAIYSKKGLAKASEMIAKRSTPSGRAKSGQGANVAQIRQIRGSGRGRFDREGLGGTPMTPTMAKNPIKKQSYDGTGNKAARRAGLTPTKEKPNAWKEEYMDEAQAARENPEKYEREQAKKSAPVRGERTPMPPRGDKRREDFEKWYAANVR